MGTNQSSKITTIQDELLSPISQPGAPFNTCTCTDKQVCSHCPQSKIRAFDAKYNNVDPNKYVKTAGASLSRQYVLSRKRVKRDMERSLSAQRGSKVRLSWADFDAIHKSFTDKFKSKHQEEMSEQEYATVDTSGNVVETVE